MNQRRVLDTRGCRDTESSEATAWNAKPFLKWTGGKQWLAPALAPHITIAKGKAYFEPFLGGGSMFFNVRPKRSLLSDANGELVNCYRAVRDNAEAVIDGLFRLKSDRATFDKIKRSSPRSRAGRAVRFIYLNKTAFNGIWRVNRDGVFNVPFGQYGNPMICAESRLRAASLALSNAILRTWDFEYTASLARRGDTVYFDPPYVTGHINNGFRKYNKRLFSWDDQERLADVATDLAGRGVNVFVSNASHVDVLRLYRPFHIVLLDRASLIGGGMDYRGRVTEALISSERISIRGGVRHGKR
jgi:DNA adenine methylase